MDRRNFLKTTAATTAALSGVNANPAAAHAPQAAARGQLKIGHQNHSSDPELRVLAAFGVQHICSVLPSRKFDDAWSVESLGRLRERVERSGIKLDMVPLPLSSSNIRSAENPNILLGKSPERDTEIRNICQMIKNCAQAGIMAVKYNLTIIGVIRSGTTPGRGGARYSTFVYDQAVKQNPNPIPESGPVSEKQMWERITYFLERVVPVADEAKVRICMHPHDPGMPRNTPFRGVHQVLGTVEGMQRFIDIARSDYHGLNFCQGTVCEMLANPNKELWDVIRYFGTSARRFLTSTSAISQGAISISKRPSPMTATSTCSRRCAFTKRWVTTP